MFNLLRKLFIKDYQNTKDSKVRGAYGNLASFVGIISNVLLFGFKMVIGLITASISIITDSINNLSDMGSSVISLVGFKISQKPADRDHPFGHERFEYISGLIVSIIIIFIGGSLAIESVKEFIASLYVDNEALDLTTFIITISILVGSILLKVWQGLFYKKSAKTIESVSLEASSQDSFNDVISTCAILVSTIVCYFIPNIHVGGINIDLDSILGVIVSIYIIISGFGMIKETADPLLGMSPDKELVNNVVADILKYDGALGVHDLIAHMYGPTKCFMSIHVEVDARNNVMECHDMIDNIELDIKKKYGIEIVIHMDPVDLDNPVLQAAREIIKNKTEEMPKGLSFHDLRVVDGPTHLNIIFDVVVPFKYELSDDEIKSALQKEIRSKKIVDKKVFVVINFDIEYTERG